MAADKKRSGDPCECGEGRFRAYTSRRVGDEYQMRYLECVRCGAKCRCVVKSNEVVRRSRTGT